MTKKDVINILKNINEASLDDEIAHGKEDDLYYDILESIANESCEDPKECSSLAITSKKINFSRWCA